MIFRNLLRAGPKVIDRPGRLTSNVLQGGTFGSDDGPVGTVQWRQTR